MPLPEENVDFNELAKSLAASLPRDAALPADRGAIEAWQQQRREALKALLRVPQYNVTAEKCTDFKGTTVGGSHALAIGNDWTVPASEFVPTTKAYRGIVVLVSDGGRAGQAAEVERWLASGHRVIAVDLLLWGESKPTAQDPDYTYPLFMSAVGERPLGIQAAQLAAVARWAQTRGVPKPRPVRIVAVGPRASAAALVASALEPEAIAGVELSGALASFHQLIERNVAVEAMPELFAFGLLAEFDVRQLVALSAPRPVTFRDQDERTEQELAPLASWYELFGAKFKPAAK